MYIIFLKIAAGPSSPRGPDIYLYIMYREAPSRGDARKAGIRIPAGLCIFQTKGNDGEDIKRTLSAAGAEDALRRGVHTNKADLSSV
jgi:hypothetical protein